jgi:hypothetical protein
MYQKLLRLQLTNFRKKLECLSLTSISNLVQCLQVRPEPTRVMHISGQGTLKGGSIIVVLTSCLTGLELAVWQLKFFVFICKTDSSKQVKQEVNCTVILPPLVFPALVLHSSAGSWAFPKKH